MTLPVSGGSKSINSIFKNRKILILMAALILAPVIFWLWSANQSKRGTYLTSNVVKGDVLNTITATGMVEAENSVPLIFKNSAVIKAIYVKEGQRVKKGDLLAEQDDRDLLAQYQQQMANLKAAEAKLSLARAGARREEISQSEENVNIARITYEQAKSNYERSAALYEQGALARVEKEKAESDYRLAGAKLNQAREQLNVLKAGSRPEDILSAESQVESARAQIQTAKNNLDSAKLVAPDNGFIGQISAVVGQRTSGVGNSSGEDGFITLISDRLYVKAQVNEADIGRASVGQKVFFTVNSFPGKKFGGVLESISPKAVTVSNVQFYQVRISIEKQDAALKVGMPANVSIIVEQRSGVTLLPKIAASFTAQESSKTNSQPDAAVAQGDNQNQQRGSARRQGSGGGDPPQKADGRKIPVLVMENGKPALRQVQVGISDNTNYEVLSGLNEGEQVVIGSTAQPAAAPRQNTGQSIPFGNTPRGLR
ncbi:MAG: HlyD family secretion protein [Bacillota bacterium]